MKRISILGTILGLITILFSSCETRDDSLSVNENDAPVAKKSNVLSCEELLNAPEDYAGKTITLNAISWGSNESFDGEEILMSIDDEKLEGLQQAHVLVHFSKDQEEEIKKVQENDSVSLNATVGEYESGALRLTKAKVIRL